MLRNLKFISHTNYLDDDFEENRHSTISSYRRMIMMWSDFPITQGGANEVTCQSEVRRFPEAKDFRWASFHRSLLEKFISSVFALDVPIIYEFSTLCPRRV